MRVSTRIFSPVVMNSGTWICAPVSRVAGLVPPVDRSPCRPGSVWLTVSSTDGRELDVQRHAVVEGDRGHLLLEQVVGHAAHGLGRDVRLVVVLGVHEDELIALAVEVLHLPLVDGGDLHPDAGVEGAVHHLARHHVLQLGADEGAALARLDVLEVDDVPELAVDAQGHAVLQVIRGGHVCLSPARIRDRSSGESRNTVTGRAVPWWSW